MPTEPLSDKEIAELRKLDRDSRIEGGPNAARILFAAAKALPQLLDEVEKVRAGAVLIRLEEDGKSVPFGDAVLEVVAKYRAMLKRIEWGALDTDQRGHCPVCGAWSQAGTHKADCELAALLG